MLVVYYISSSNEMITNTYILLLLFIGHFILKNERRCKQ